MSGVTKYDIQSVMKMIGSGPVDLGLGAVPSGMKRYVTFINVQNTYGGAQVAYLASTAATTFASTPTLASAASKFTMKMHSADDDQQFPKSQPDYDHPLFSIAEDTFLDALCSLGNAYLYLQYYDA